MISWLKQQQVDPFSPAAGAPPRDLWPFMQWALADSWPTIRIAAVLSCVAGAMDAVAALILGILVDSTISRAPEAYFSFGTIALIIGAISFFLLLRPVVQGATAYMLGYMLAPNLQPLILSRLHRWTLGQSVDFFDSDFAGRIAQKQMQTSNALTQVVMECLHVVAFALATAIGALALLSSIDLRIGLIFLCWFSVYIAMIRWFLPRIRGRAKARAASRALVSGKVVDTITNIKTVKLFAHATQEDQSALNAMEGFRQKAQDFGLESALFRLVLMASGGLLPVLLIGATLWIWTQGGASAGQIAAAGTISLRIAQMTGWFSFSLMGIYANIGEVEDGMHTLTVRDRVEDAQDARELVVQNSEISLDRVSFAYGQDQGGGVSDVTMTVKPGEKLGIVGASGAGKSTLVALLLRLYDPEIGALKIDGQNIRAISQDSLRRSIGMVTQETAMFNRSARENILYGRQGATEAQMIAAAKKAEAHEFIITLQDHEGRTGYDAHLGERGVKLSGGQRQRIALARAILKNAPILILDEATSALDSEVEAAIQDALQHVMEGKTVLAIAHRLSTIAQMDRIIVLDQGRIVEDGTHEELLAVDGLYARYWDRQSGGFIGAELDDLSKAAE